jgi:hypothetical protein
MEKIGAAFLAIGTSSAIFAMDLVPEKLWYYVHEKGVLAIALVATACVLYKLFLLFVQTKDTQVKAAERRENDIGSILDSERKEFRKERKEQHEKMMGAMAELTESVNCLTRTFDSEISIRPGNSSGIFNVNDL